MECPENVPAKIKYKLKLGSLAFSFESTVVYYFEITLCAIKSTPTFA